MKETDSLQAEQLADLLKSVSARQTVAIMTHLSRGKWHMTKVTLRKSSETIQIDISPKDKHHPININIDQPIGLSFKHDSSKYVFETCVIGFEPSVNTKSGGVVVAAIPEKIDRIQRRSYYRVQVPAELNVRVLFWHRGYSDEAGQVPLENYWQAGLIDVSAGGLQVSINSEQRPNFRPGQLVGLQFTPSPYEQPIQLEAQVRHVAPTANNDKICLGLQVIGLEATAEGRQMLHRLCQVVERYFEMNQKAGLIQPADALANSSAELFI